MVPVDASELERKLKYFTDSVRKQVWTLINLFDHVARKATSSNLKNGYNT